MRDNTSTFRECGVFYGGKRLFSESVCLRRCLKNKNIQHMQYTIQHKLKNRKCKTKWFLVSLSFGLWGSLSVRCFYTFLHLNTFVFNNLDLVYFFRKKEYILTLTEHFLYFLDFIFIRTGSEH